MNVERATSSDPEHYRSLQILDELANDDSLTQRDLSGRLGIALGLVNSYIKNLVKKGFITVKTIPSKRYAYYLTPKGFTEKTRLAYDLLQDYTRIYREARSNYRKLFLDLERDGLKRVLFAGADEVADFAYITLQETGLELVGVVDPDKAGEMFFGRQISPLGGLQDKIYDSIVITSYLKREAMHQILLSQGIKEKNIRTIFKLR
jgi:DNA-binding MarR family transcriptional regulator